MKPLNESDRILDKPGAKHPRMGLVLSLILFVASALLLVLMALPYITLWQLDQAVRSADSSTLADLVDLDAVRSEIKKKLNKDKDSAIGELSDPFIQWLEEGIQTMGSGAVERLVTLSWVRVQLLDHTAGDGGEGFVGQVSYAFFHASDGFAVRIGPAGDHPIHLFLKRTGLNWRVSAVYY